ncbi:MAG: pyrroline-5-carboxylate reductase [Clostridia bacterium]|nr:pyrroline-5-carboxylate reductase [Clostridia bacterium]
MKVGFIGCGNMGSALATAISRVKTTDVYIYDPNTEKTKAFADSINANISSAEDIAALCDYIFLAVKPIMALSVIKSLSPYIKKGKGCVVSMLAGKEIRALELLGLPDTPIIRIMPNTAVKLGRGVTVYAANSLVTDSIEAGFKQIMKETGLLDKLPESLIDAESAIAGSGPAFAYIFADALAAGGVAQGLPRDKALLYAAKMLEGAAAMLISSGEHPDKLRDDVCSPGGSTVEGVIALERAGFRGAVADAIAATVDKVKKL